MGSLYFAQPVLALGQMETRDERAWMYLQEEYPVQAHRASLQSMGRLNRMVLVQVRALLDLPLRMGLVQMAQARTAQVHASRLQKVPAQMVLIQMVRSRAVQTQKVPLRMVPAQKELGHTVPCPAVLALAVWIQMVQAQMVLQQKRVLALG